MSISVTLAV